MRAWQAMVVTATLGVVSGAWAEPRFAQTILSDREGGASMRIFSTATPAIHLVAKLSEVAPGSMVKATWVAEKTDAAPPNYVIRSSEAKTGANTASATFTLAKPGGGWPTGSYRVDLFIDGQAAGKVPFIVEKPR